MSTIPEPRLTVSLSPHDKDRRFFSSTKRIMWGVVAALVPAMVASVVVFGPRALLVYAVSVGVCVLTEYVVDSISRSRGNAGPRPHPRGGSLASAEPSIANGSAVITGILLAMNLPVTLPVWMVAVGALFAVGVAKMVFGGLGQNPFNPALAGRAFLLASFANEMSGRGAFPAPFAWQGGVDAVGSATVLASIKEGLHGAPLPDLWALFVGARGGCIGEVSVAALLAGGVFLLCSRIITWEVPVLFLGGIAAVTGAFWLVDPGHYASPVLHLMTGGAVLGAFFMATDMVTIPMTFLGRVIFALCAGVLTALIRLFGGYPEGVSYAILIMNALVPLIDRNLPPARFGARGFKIAKEARP